MKLAKLGEWTLLLLLFAFLDASVVAPNDFWWHVKTGEIIASTGHIPHIELFAYTREGARWVNEPWLMQLFMAGVFEAGGLPLVIFVHALVVTSGYATIYGVTRRRWGLHAAALSTLLGMCVGAANWSIRPQGASFLCFGAVVALIELDRDGRRRALWFTAPIFALWANCHGGFTFGLVALGTYLAGRITADRKSADVRRWIGVGLSATVACMLTPIGPRGLLDHVAAFFSSSAAGIENAEFAPLTIHAADGLIFIYAVGRFVVASVRAKRMPRADELAQLIVFGLLALAARRLTPWFGLVLIPILARALADESTAREKADGQTTSDESTQRRLRLLAVVGLVAVVLTLPWLRPRLPGVRFDPTFTDADTPIDGAKWLCEHVPAGERVYSGQVHASYLEWACPRVGVFVDTRVQAFPRQIWDAYLAVESGRFDWEEILAQWKIKWLMIDPQHPIMLGSTRVSGHWTKVFSDARAIVYQRIER